jgi:hypothetical protein
VNVPRYEADSHAYSGNTPVQALPGRFRANVVFPDRGVVDRFNRIVGQAFRIVNVAAGSWVLCADLLA